MPAGSEQKPAADCSIMYVWQLINIVMASFFIFAAVANMNDGDWYIWVPIYLIPAGLAGSIVLKPKLAESNVWNSLLVIKFTFCCAFAVYQLVLLLTDLGSNVENPLKHETGREMGGLLIIITWLGICRFTNIARPSTGVSNRGLTSALLLITVTLTVVPLFVWSLCFVSDWHTRLGHCNGMFAK